MARLFISDVGHLSKGDKVRLFLEGYGDIDATICRVGDGDIALMFRKAIIGKLPR